MKAPRSTTHLDTREALVALVREVFAEPSKGTEKIGALKVLAALLPDEDHATIRGQLEALYPNLKGSRARLQALQLAAVLLDVAERPRSFGEQVLLAMASDA